MSVTTKKWLKISGEDHYVYCSITVSDYYGQSTVLLGHIVNREYHKTHYTPIETVLIETTNEDDRIIEDIMIYEMLG